MRSRISFFDRNLSKSLLKRFWPLWLGYLLVLLWALPVYIFNYSSTSWANFDLSSRVLQAARDSVLYLSVASVLTAMAVFSHLYNRKDCGLINSLPLRRETVFCTACVTGLLALLLCALLAWLAAMAAFGTSPRVGPGPLGDWLLSMTLNTLSFYGIAVFCAMLTGNVLAVPALFVVINTAAYFLEAMGQSLMSVLIYGFYPGDPLLVWLSPTICILKSSGLTTTPVRPVWKGLEF